ncbi:hypothetical protein [Chryseobacterium sp.]|uniref:hypothetical protein n=1 Tax=Chryseobacterium sp. TaxID=1871047 RepID=UPI00388E826D
MLKNNRYFTQSLLLLSTTVFSVGFIFLYNFMLSKLLGDLDYGNFSLGVNYFNLIQVLFNFGLFYGAGRILSLKDTNNDQSIRSIYGNSISIIFLNYFILCVLVLMFFLLFKVNDNFLKSVFICSLPLLWLSIMNGHNEIILQSRNEIFLLSISRLLPKFIFVIIIGFYYYNNYDLGSADSFLLYNLCFLPVFFLLILFLKPSITNFKYSISEIFYETKKFGFNVYIGSIIAVGASSITGIIISMYGVNNAEVGYFNLALQITAPLSLVPNILGTVLFKKFSQELSINTGIILLVIGINIIMLIILLLFSDIFILLVFGDSFIYTAKLIKWLSVSSILYGISDFFNKFLLSHGKGSELRNASFLVGGTLLIGNLVFINFWGSLGATLALIMAGSIYLAVVLFYYNKFTKTNCG